MGKIYPITDPDRPVGFQKAEAPRIPRQSAHEDGRDVSPTHRPLLSPHPQEIMLVLKSAGG